MTLASTFVSLGGRPEDVGKFANPKNIGELEEPLRSRIWTVVVDAPSDGLALVSGRRSPWQQYLLRVERVGAARAFNRAYPGYPRTAIPYSSNHQRGTAADMGGRELSWLINNASAYGLGRTVPSENWHYEAVGTPSVRILPYPGGVGSQLPQEFTVDAEAKARFDRIEKQNADQLGWMMRMEARMEGLEAERWKPTTRRTRLLLKHFGIKDEA